MLFGSWNKRTPGLKLKLNQYWESLSSRRQWKSSNCKKKAGGGSDRVISLLYTKSEKENKETDAVLFFFHLLTVKPLSARINQAPDRLVANQRHQIECIATGSRPLAMVSLYHTLYKFNK
jgi:hypothetical protein